MVSKPNQSPLTFTFLLFFIFTTSMAALSLSYVTTPSSSTLSCIFSLITLLFTLSLFSLTLCLLKLTKNSKKEQKTDPQPQTSIISLQISLSSLSTNTNKPHFLTLPNSLLFKAALFPPVSRVSSPGPGSGDSSVEQIEYNPSSDIEKKKKKKKKGKRKQDSFEPHSSKIVVLGDGGSVENGGGEVGLFFEEYPFTTSSSLIQKKLKEQYDEFVKLHESKELPIAQVGQFINCMVEAKKELQHKSECLKRKFTITKALLHKANRSSFDRLQQQICKIELEQKRLQEDANVYNWLQQQVKFSPVYKKMVEIRDSTELKAKSGELPENTDRDDEQNQMSFEEFLAQEKKDVFWQKYGKLKTGVSRPM